ncbi:MAG: hypothetical protein IPP81_19975 [Chitinophagaceae bacterium]|nr:hypothetical protein [Chitinophagaceae bacterium]
MRQLIFLLAFPLFLISCGLNDTKQKELELKENELALKQKALDLKEKQISGDTTAKNVAPTNTATIEQIVLDIRSEFKRINSLRLTTKKYKFVCDTDGTITYYSDNGRVVKIAIDWGFIGDGSSKSEYYYKDDKLIFTYETYIGGPANGPETKTEYRTYVNSDKTIKYMENQKISACTTCQFNESAREYKALRAYNTKNIKSALCN